MRSKVALAILAPLFCSLATSAGAAQNAAQDAVKKEHTRPRITGISHIAVYAGDMKATGDYYAKAIGAQKEPDPENNDGARYMVNATQFVEVLPLPAGTGINRLDHTGWNTDNAEGMRVYLAGKGWKTPAKVTTNSDGSKSFRVNDPENNVVEFVQPPAHPKAVNTSAEPGHHIIHIGFMVHSRETEDKFYKDLLGFKPYWFGGMQEGKIDWVSQQAPEGHDWLEYMMTSGPSGSGIPANMTQRALGVLDHLSIGVVAMPDAYKKLVAENRLTGRVDKEPKIGKDGKYQFNLYDPDGIRLELMEFHAREKPCCSPFTAEDPAE